MPVWEAEIVVDEPLARRLLGQFSDLAVDALHPLGHGWDYTIWVVDERLAFRFPRREIVVAGTEREIAVLPNLAPLLPVAVPEPLYVGRPSDVYPWPFFGSRLLPGQETSDAALDAEDRLAIALELAGFLRTLHGVELDEPLPLDISRRADMSARVPQARETLAAISGLWRAPSSVASILDGAQGLPPAELNSVVHGDLHFRQVLVDGRRVTGVVDWVDVCRSDPAIDVSLLWSFLEPSQRPAFIEAYGDLTEEQLLRARVLALNLCAALAGHAHAEGLIAVEREALAGLDRASR